MALTALVVDDHRLFRATARMLLESEGFDVVGEAEDGASALSEVARLRPDVVLLDVQLPDATGFDVAKQVTSRGDGSRVVLVSSRSASEYGELVAECGAVGFIAKDELSGQSLGAALREGRADEDR
jgi:DNA-binding NarL/FixJ family response regulator